MPRVLSILTRKWFRKSRPRSPATPRSNSASWETTRIGATRAPPTPRYAPDLGNVKARCQVPGRNGFRPDCPSTGRAGRSPTASKPGGGPAPRPARGSAGTEPPRPLLRSDRDDAGRAVDGDLELIEEVPAEQPIALGEIDVMCRDAERARAGAADLDALDGYEEDVGGTRRSFHRSAEGLRRSDAHPREYPRIDHGHRCAGVEHEIGRAAAIDLGRDHDGLAGGEWNLRRRRCSALRR